MPDPSLPSSPLFRLLVPSTPRRFPGQRWVKVFLRGLHVLFTGIFVGALCLAVAPEVRATWFHVALLSGVVLIAADLYETGAFLFQIRGLVVAVKLVLLALVESLGTAAPWVLGAVVVASVVSSHASSKFRYFLVWGRGRIVASETKG